MATENSCQCNRLFSLQDNFDETLSAFLLRYVLSTFRNAKSSDQKILKKFNFSEIISYLLPTCQVKLMEELLAKSISG